MANNAWDNENIWNPQQQASGASVQPAKSKWGGWNKDNIFDYEAINERAKAGEFDLSRDEIANQRDAFGRSLEESYLNARGGRRIEGTGAVLFNDPRFRHFVQTGQLSPEDAAQNSGGSTTTSTTSTTRDPRSDELYRMLMERATQSKAIDRNDPIIRAQADAYAANEERSKRGYLSDVAERGGQFANMRGEQRMAAERVGQRTGAMESQLLGRELTARREEITQALMQMGDMLSDEQQIALQRELGHLDAAIRREQMKSESDLGWGRLGLDAEDRASYWDWLRSGGARR